MTPPLSDHFNGKTFFQSHHNGAVRRRDLWRWQLTAKPKPWPRQVCIAPQPAPPTPQADEIVVTWIGHASFLIQSTAGNVLTDPVFSDRASPVTWAGPRRVHPPGVALDALPPIDAVLLSHDHYDHCDVRSLRALAARHDPLFVAPLRHDDLLEQAGARRTLELDWWQDHETDRGLQLTLTPAQHWSNRFGTPRNHRLWGGYYLAFPSPGSGKRVWFVGDSGYDVAWVRRVRERLGAPNLTLTPIGAYEPRWFMAPMHMNPAEAVELHREVGARISIGMHWGTFRLTDEGRDDPVTALEQARQTAGLAAEAFRVLCPGESCVI